MRSILFSAVMGVAVLGSMLMTPSTADAQYRRGGYSAGVYVGPRGTGAYSGRNYGYYGNRYYDGRYYGTRYYDGRYYGDRYYSRYYGDRYYDSYSYPSSRTSYYYGPSSDRYYYYTSNGWRICRDRYTDDYWYLSGGYWYRWY
jgi:hypothetical protein